MKPKFTSRNSATVAPRAGFVIPESGDLPTAGDAYAGQTRLSGGYPYFCDGTAWRCLVTGISQSATIAAGVVTLDGRMVDAPVLRLAQRTLTRKSQQPPG